MFAFFEQEEVILTSFTLFVYELVYIPSLPSGSTSQYINIAHWCCNIILLRAAMQFFVMKVTTIWLNFF